MDLDPGELERRYLALSRECHPDHQPTESPQEQQLVLERAAKLNDSYRRLKDPWSRATALLNLSEPGILDRTKQLSPTFLMEAMEISEAALVARGAEADDLRNRLERSIAASLEDITSKIGARDWAAAATALHESRYYRKALADLQANQ